MRMVAVALPLRQIGNKYTPDAELHGARPVSNPVPAQTAFKAALYEEIQSQSLSKIQLAARLGVVEKEVRRLLDPRHSSKLPRIAEILELVGKHIVVGVQDDKEIPARLLR
jgi:hypothetical protein